jgi:hypothetical protein
MDFLRRELWRGSHDTGHVSSFLTTLIKRSRSLDLVTLHTRNLNSLPTSSPFVLPFPLLLYVLSFRPIILILLLLRPCFASFLHLDPSYHPPPVFPCFLSPVCPPVLTLLVMGGQSTSTAAFLLEEGCISFAGQLDLKTGK